jgi:hypothetical protein
MLDEGFRKLVEGIEVIRRVVEIFSPVESQPFHRIQDRIDVLCFLRYRVGVVETHMAAATVLQGHAEIQADRFRMAVVQVAVGLRWKTRADARRIGGRAGVCRCRTGFTLPCAAGVCSLRQVVFDDVANEIGDLGDGVRLRLVAGCRFVHAG